MELGARIRDLRVERGLTQRELAEPGYSRGFLAAVWNAQGQLAEVDAALSTARGIWAELGMEREIGRCHWTRGYVLVRMDKLAEAADELVQARDILSRVDARHFFGGATMELAEVRRRQGRFDEAETLCLQVAEVVKAANYDEGIAEADRLLGRLAIARDDLAAAETLLSRAADRYQATTAKPNRCCAKRSRSTARPAPAASWPAACVPSAICCVRGPASPRRPTCSAPACSTSNAWSSTQLGGGAAP